MTDVAGIADLPDTLAIFPLPRVILLPRVDMPLNIFEKRYLAMIDAALSSSRLIGMVQPDPADDGKKALCGVGCAGRIVSYTETDDGRYLVKLRGLCRFRVAAEMVPAPDGFRRIRPDWSPYAGYDLSADTSHEICRDTMMQTLLGYFDKTGLFCDQWENIKDISCEKLVSTLSVVCPFPAGEKQALLEAASLATRAQMLQGLMEHAIRETGRETERGTGRGGDTPCCH